MVGSSVLTLLLSHRKGIQSLKSWLHLCAKGSFIGGGPAQLGVTLEKPAG